MRIEIEIDKKLYESIEVTPALMDEFEIYGREIKKKPEEIAEVLIKAIQRTFGVHESVLDKLDIRDLIKIIDHCSDWFIKLYSH